MWKLLIASVVFLSISTRQIDENVILKRHNYYREQVGVQALKLNKECQETAQKWAEYLAKRNRGLSHSNNRKYGQNCYWNSVSSTEEQVVDSWASEKRYFNSKTRKYSSKTGHYTQIIWRDTKFVGVGMAIANDGSEYWVCNYYPPGNYTNQKAY